MYNDDPVDYCTNEPEMDGTADVVFFTAWVALEGIGQ
jgi:hypothetical protein